MNIFELTSASSGYGTTDVIRDMDLTIGQGDFLGIIGPNGSGKSTLIKMLSGILPLQRGKVQLHGKEIELYEQKELARMMSMVPQFFENIISFPVKDFIISGRFPYKNFWDGNTGDDIKKVNEAIEITGIEHIRDRSITELSGGELQLVSIARALVQNSDLLLLDEPLSNLDLNHSIHIMDILHGLNSRGSTIIMVLHDINLASDYCSRIIALKDGSIFTDGTPEESIEIDTIKKLYNTHCSIEKNPVTGKPCVYPHPGYDKRRNNE